MRRALALVAGVIVACGGSGGAGNPLSGRDPAPSGLDPAPSSGDTPPDSWQAPPPSGDPPPQMGGCVACTGSYSCTDGDAGSVTITLTPDNDTCDVQVDEQIIATIVACGESSLPGSGDAGTTSYTVEADGTVESCPSPGANDCIVCTPTSATTSDAGATVGGSTPPSGSAECSDLQSCCESLSSGLQPNCNAIVSDGNTAVCSTTLSAYETAGLCH